MSDSTSTAQWTIQRLLEWTTEFFSKSESSSSPRLEAETLLAEALGCQRIELYTRFAEVPEPDKLTEFRAWVKRRGAGEPVAYLVGHREFYSLKFAVTSDVLIPRPETEHVVVSALEAAKQLDAKPIRIVDVGTGSGCIAITLATQLTDCKIAATDISQPALEVARTNAQSHEVEDRVRFFQGDLLDALPNGSDPVHMIVSNPPYIGESEVNTVDAQVKDHEPAVALFSGEFGTDIITKLVAAAPDCLLPGGFLIFETSPIVMDKCVELVKSNSAFESVEVVKDFSGHQRVVVAKKIDG